MTSSSVSRSEQEQLRRNFAAMDTNGDGRIDREEMDAFLSQKGIDDEHRHQILDEIFEKIDKDGNGRIELDEFSEQYVSTKNQLIERESEIKQNIMSNNSRLKQAREELTQAKKTHGSFISGPMGLLYISVIRAENLGDVKNSHVICYQGSKHGQTRPAKGPAPTYGDSELKFEVDDDHNPLVV